MATGRLDELAKEAVQTCVLDGMQCGMGRLSPEQVSILTSDATLAQGHFQLQLAVKLDHWVRVPWLLCGVSHWNSEKAREVAKKAVVALRNCNFRAQSSLTQKWMQDPLFTNLRLFAEGRPMCMLAETFQKEIANLFFMPMNECVIEAKHALASRASAKSGQAGAAVVSLSNRWPLLHAELANMEPSSLAQLLNAMDIARDLKAVHY